MEQTERRSSSNSQSAGNASRSTFSGSRPTETRDPEQEETSGKQRPTETRDTNDSTYASRMTIQDKLSAASITFFRRFQRAVKAYCIHARQTTGMSIV